jgi:chromosome segregation ATPase
MRRACDLNLSDLQVENARQLSVLRRKNDSLGRENDQLRIQAGTAASELSAASERQRHELSELERRLEASKRERVEEVHALEARLGELAAKLQCLEAKNIELEAGGRDAVKVRQAAVSGLEAAVSGLEEENRGLRQEVRLRRQDMSHILEEREEMLGEARAREDHLINSLRVWSAFYSDFILHC